MRNDPQDEEHELKKEQTKVRELEAMLKEAEKENEKLKKELNYTCCSGLTAMLGLLSRALTYLPSMTTVNFGILILLALKQYSLEHQINIDQVSSSD